jgi:HSP20 family molecular chaperone IbpA
MSFFFYDEPIKESDRSILNNSVVDESEKDNENENTYYVNPYLSGYPFYYGYPPFFYSYPLTSNSESDTESRNKTSETVKPVTESKPVKSAVPAPVPTPMATAVPAPVPTPVPTPVPAAIPHPKAQAKSASRKRSTRHDKDVYKLVDFRPNNDLCEDENNYYIQLDLPGMSKEQIHMELSEDRILKISGKRQNKYKSPEMKNNLKISKMDCQYGKFSRAFNIHETANLDKIQAKMENGVLLVTIPKDVPPKTQHRTIQVQ